MKTLILKSDRGSFEKFYLRHMKKEYVDARPFFKKMGEGMRYFSLIHIQLLKLPFQSIWYGGWKDELNDYDRVIVFDRNYNWDILKYIHKKNPNCRIIVWYWNPLSKSERIPEKYRKFCEEWSFDLADCQKYNLQYNVQFTFRELYMELGINEYDLYFLGVDKGRATELSRLKKIAEKIGKKTKFLVIKDKESKCEQIEYSNSISYEENLQNLKKSICVVEMTQCQQSGLTLRAIEALASGKKILTNNRALMNYEFYDPTRILTIDNSIDFEKKLKEFLEVNLDEMDRSYSSRYFFEAWLENFDL